MRRIATGLIAFAAGAALAAPGVAGGAGTAAGPAKGKTSVCGDSITSFGRELKGPRRLKGPPDKSLTCS